MTDKIKAAEALERFVQPLMEVIAVAKDLRAAGSLEQAATDAQKRLDSLHAASADLEKTIADRMKEETARRGVADGYALRTRTEADQIKNAAAEHLNARRREAEKIVADAKAEAAAIAKAAKDEGKRLFDEAKKAREEHETALAQRRQELAAATDALQKTRATMDDMKARVASIAAA